MSPPVSVQLIKSALKGFTKSYRVTVVSNDEQFANTKKVIRSQLISDLKAI